MSVIAAAPLRILPGGKFWNIFLRQPRDVDVEGYRPRPGETDQQGYEIEDRLYNQKDFDRHLVIDERTRRAPGGYRISSSIAATASKRPLSSAWIPSTLRVCVR